MRGELTRRIDGIAITNGPAVSPDGRLLYFVDTLQRHDRNGRLSATDGSLEDRRPFARIDPRRWSSRRTEVDCEGCLWICLYAGWEAWRYSPGGELVEKVRFPVANITKIAFGGGDLRTAFATTARQGLKAADIAKQPLIGDLFEFRTDVAGVPCPLVEL